MTETLLQKLEEKMMMLLSEVEELRLEVRHLHHENSSLKMEREKYQAERINHERKLQDLLSLFDTVKAVEASIVSTNVAA